MLAAMALIVRHALCPHGGLQQHLTFWVQASDCWRRVSMVVAALLLVGRTENLFSSCISSLRASLSALSFSMAALQDNAFECASVAKHTWGQWCRIACNATRLQPHLCLMKNCCVSAKTLCSAVAIFCLCGHTVRTGKRLNGNFTSATIGRAFMSSRWIPWGREHHTIFRSLSDPRRGVNPADEIPDAIDETPAKAGVVTCPLPPGSIWQIRFSSVSRRAAVELYTVTTSIAASWAYLLPVRYDNPGQLSDSPRALSALTQRSNDCTRNGERLTCALPSFSSVKEGDSCSGVRSYSDTRVPELVQIPRLGLASSLFTA